jgi:hypothetical protein
MRKSAEGCRCRIGRLRQRVSLDLLRVGDRLGDISIIAAPDIGAQQRVDPSGIFSAYPGGRIRYLPPLPLSAPAGPTSSRAACQASMIVPVI